MAKKKELLKVNGYVRKGSLSKLYQARLEDKSGCLHFKVQEQKRQKDAIEACNEAAARLGWELDGPYEKEA